MVNHEISGGQAVSAQKLQVDLLGHIIQSSHRDLATTTLDPVPSNFDKGSQAHWLFGIRNLDHY